MLILADSGILLRLFDPIDSLHATVDAAVRALRARGDKLVYSLQNAAEFWNVCTRPATARGGLGLDLVETQYRLGMIEKGFTLITEPHGLYSVWRQLVVAHSVLGKQVHDARLVALMQAQSISHILTLNGGDFARYPGIVTIDPASVIPPLQSPSP
jgi:predicted nucleic acid-binding protein